MLATMWSATVKPNVGKAMRSNSAQSSSARIPADLSMPLRFWGDQVNYPPALELSVRPSNAELAINVAPGTTAAHGFVSAMTRSLNKTMYHFASCHQWPQSERSALRAAFKLVGGGNNDAAVFFDRYRRCRALMKAPGATNLLARWFRNVTATIESFLSKRINFH
jgi:hypothetical protein